ncbi:MAG: glycosyltransferase [Actinomycetota bacterium]
MPEDAGASPPAAALELARRRDEHRAAKEFAEADRLRDELGALGWRVVDTPEGTRLESAAGVAPTPDPPRRPEDIASVLSEPTTVDASVHWLVEGWPEDVLRGIESVRRFEPARRVQQVVVDVAGTDPSVWPADVETIRLVEGTGWATARNAGLRTSRGEVVLVLDGSVEATGDVLGPLIDALADPGIGICGPFGIVTEDLHEFHEVSDPQTGPDVDAIEGYLFAVHRSMLAEAGPLDERFRFYRSCDIDYSFRVKDTGRRAVVVPVPVRRHEHRMWAATPPERRDQLSKRNFYRFLERFRGRFDLTVAGTRPQHGSDDGSQAPG